MNAMQRCLCAIAAGAALLAVIAACGTREHADGAHGAEQAAGEFERGPHGGRMLRDGDFAVELTIFEDGVPPEFHVYAFEGDRPLSPHEVRLTVELGRLGGRTDRFAFTPEADFLKGAGVVKEPHSFDVKVTAARAGKTSSWGFASYEGRVEIGADAAKAALIIVEVAGPAAIREQRILTGTIQANPARLAKVRARFPGVIREVRRGLGEAVAAGDLLATVQSNESFETYPVTSPVGGVVLVRSAVAGESTGEEPLFVVGDLSKLWAELDVFGRDLASIKPGQPVRVASLDEQQAAESVIAAISPVTTHASQSVRARVVLDNGQGLWRPGQFVHGEVTVAETSTPLAVKNSALQRFRDFTVVFAQVGDTYEVRMLELGKTDGIWSEVLGGLEPGERYVTANSFLIKADIEKSGASHDH
ncbi:MAG: efflux RND transporter periplasmic adaptor subunit [Steroidobacteraceae bacterium]